MVEIVLRRRWACIAVGMLAFLSACGKEKPAAPTPEERLTLTRTSFAALPGWASDRTAEALPALLRSCARLAALPPDRPAGGDAEALAGVVAGDWRNACTAAASVPTGGAGADAAARAFFEARFVPFRAGNGGEESGLFTGYYEAELRAARQRSDRFSTPLYRRPPDLVSVDLGEFRDKLKGERIAGRVVDGKLKPYATRAEIEDGALAGRGLELLWVDDPVDAFFLAVQGSGRATLPDGRIVRLGYADQNGHAYVAIGRELIERGAVARDAMSMQAIRAWIAANPQEGRELMRRNPSYVFFRELQGEGPLGAQGAALTPGRSLAVDRRFLPLGVPVWLDAESPTRPGERLQRLVVAQDTGGAIKGPVRGDLFWGAGKEAEQIAGVMKSRGGYALLLPQEAARRIAGKP